MQTKKYMSKALDLAVAGINDNKGGPFGAVIVRNDAIISQGQNEVTSLNDPTAHAEIQAIRQACQALNQYHLTDCILYTTCEPCPMCLAAIYWAHIDKVYYAATRMDAKQINFDDEFIYEEFAKPLTLRRVHMEQIMHDNALEIFKTWQAKPDKTTY